MDPYILLREIQNSIATRENRVASKMKESSSYDPAILLLDTQSKETKPQCPVFIAAKFIAAEVWNDPR